MPIYYHIHRSIKKSNIENNFKEGQALFFSKKKSFWYDVEKDISLSRYNGYSEYKITIPQKYFTYSLNPKSKNKILKLTPKNIEKFIKLHLNLLKSKKSLIHDFINKKFIGMDATNEDIYDFYCKLKLERQLQLEAQLYPPQGYIKKKYKDILIEKIDVCASNVNCPNS